MSLHIYVNYRIFTIFCEKAQWRIPKIGKGGGSKAVWTFFKKNIQIWDDSPKDKLMTNERKMQVTDNCKLNTNINYIPTYLMNNTKKTNKTCWKKPSYAISINLISDSKCILRLRFWHKLIMAEHKEYLNCMT